MPALETPNSATAGNMNAIVVTRTYTPRSCAPRARATTMPVTAAKPYMTARTRNVRVVPAPRRRSLAGASRKESNSRGKRMLSLRRHARPRATDRHALRSSYLFEPLHVAGYPLLDRNRGVIAQDSPGLVDVSARGQGIPISMRQEPNSGL